MSEDDPEAKEGHPEAKTDLTTTDAPKLVVEGRLAAIVSALINAPALLEEILTSIEGMREHLGNLQTTNADLTTKVAALTNKVSFELMERMDRLQDEHTKLWSETGAMFELLKNSSPATLLVRIRQQEEEIRELKQQVHELKQPPTAA